MADKLIGRTLGDFRIEELVGRGRSGRVYRAVQKSLDRPVARKVFEEGLFTLENQKERFRREAEYLTRLEHPGIVPVYAAGQEGEFWYFAMRRVEGRPSPRTSRRVCRAARAYASWPTSPGPSTTRTSAA